MADALVNHACQVWGFEIVNIFALWKQLAYITFLRPVVKAVHMLSLILWGFSIFFYTLWRSFELFSYHITCFFRYYYNSSLGYYYDPSSGLYGCAATGKWYVAVIVFVIFLYAHRTSLICMSKIIIACYCLLYGLLVNNWASWISNSISHELHEMKYLEYS